MCTYVSKSESLLPLLALNQAADDAFKVSYCRLCFALLCLVLESSQNVCSQTDYLTDDAIAILGVVVQLQVVFDSTRQYECQNASPCDPDDDSTTWRRWHKGPGPVF